MAAWIAAALTRFARSAPHSPGVDRAISSASTFYWQSKARTAPTPSARNTCGCGHSHAWLSQLAHSEYTRAVLTGGERCVLAAAVGDRQCEAMQCNGRKEIGRFTAEGPRGVVAVPGARARWTDRARGSACGRAHPVRQSEPARMALQLSTMHCNGWLADVNSFRSMRQVTIHRRPRSIPAHTRERAQATNAQQMGTAAYRRSPQGRACARPCCCRVSDTARHGYLLVEAAGPHKSLVQHLQCCRG